MVEQVKDFFEFRNLYQDTIRNLINNINICNRQYVKTVDSKKGLKTNLKVFVEKKNYRGKNWS